MPFLKENPTLSDIQKYVQQMGEERGFQDQTLQSRCLLLTEEIGELMKAIRKREGLKIDASSKIGTVEEELADIMLVLCSVANQVGVDLETAFRAKEEKNKQRVWA